MDQHVERTSCFSAVTRNLLIHCFQSLAHTFYHLCLGGGLRNCCQTHGPLTCCRVGVNVAEIQVNAARYDAARLDSDARETAADCRKQWLALCFCRKKCFPECNFSFSHQKTVGFLQELKAHTVCKNEWYIISNPELIPGF